VKSYQPEKPGSSGESIGPRAPLMEPAGRLHGTVHGGLGAIKTMLDRLRFAEVINGALGLLKVRRGYAESDHVMNIGLNALCGGQTLDDIELRRRDEHFLRSIDAVALPDPTTAGDFCRRFSQADVDALMKATNEVRREVWKSQPSEFFEVARIDADGVFVPTGSECAEGVDYSGHKRDWGYHPLVVSLANSQEPLFIRNRGGSRPSHEGAHELLDRAAGVCLKAGFKTILFRGDTDFSQTAFLDRWDAMTMVKFVFGIDAMPNLVEIADSLEERSWSPLVREKRAVDEEDERAKGTRFKDEVVREREFRNLETQCEDYAEFEYTPAACDRSYRLVVVRKSIRVTKGQQTLLPEIRYHFYISNLRDVGARDIVREANQRCNQENLNAHLKNGVHALRAPLKSLVANEAYMVMTSLAWTFKAWFAMLTPISESNETSDRSVSRRLLTMEFRTFVNNLMTIPALVIEAGRRVVIRLLTETPWTPHLLRAQHHFRE
jgi:Transposase DDE domain group 1